MQQNQTADEGLRQVSSARASARRVLVGATAGHVVEHYDYNTFGVMTVFLAPLFFPKQSPTVGILYTLAIFAIPFVFRPLGGILFGLIGDRLGRRRSLILSVTLMGLGSGLIGVLPTYGNVGYWAALLLVVLRLLQTLSAGGETGGTTTYVVESAPAGRRGWFGGILGVGPIAGLGLASTIILVMTSTLSSQQISGWAWRIPFLLALPLAGIALYIRLRLEESPAFERARASDTLVRRPVRHSLTHEWRGVAQVFGLCVVQSVGGYLVTSYAITYLTTQAGFSKQSAAILTTTTIVIGLIYIPLIGKLADRVGRKPITAVAHIGFIVLTVPMFLVLTESAGNLGLALVAYLLLTAPTYLLFGVGFTMYAELFPASVRFTAMSLGFNAAVILGGVAPFLSSFLIRLTGSALVPGFMVMVAGVISLLVLRTTRETGKSELAA